MTWIDSIAPSKPIKLKAKIHDEKIHLSWRAPKYNSSNDSAAYYVVYRFENDEAISTNFSSKIISIQKNNQFIDTTAAEDKNYKYAVTSVDRLHNESKTFAFTKVR